ncbi:MAG: LysR family transcriptional regulator [Micromonosporaceae bacterium]
MELELRHLRVVCAIADTGSVTKAAAALGVSQPALTTQLRRIERAVGGELFLRGRAGAEPTALGEFVLARARALLPAVDELSRSARREASAGQDIERVRIVAVPGPVMAGLLPRLRAMVPDAEITAETGHSAVRLTELVATGCADCALIGEPPGYEQPPAVSVECHEVVTEPVFAALPATHPLAVPEEVELAALAAEPWALPPLADDRLWEALQAVTGQVGPVPQVVYQADGGALIDLVRTGQAITLVQPTIAEHPGVVIRPIAGAPVRWRHKILWHRHSPLAALGDSLLRFAIAAYADAAERSPAYRAWRARHPVERHVVVSSSPTG